MPTTTTDVNNQTLDSVESGVTTSNPGLEQGVVNLENNYNVFRGWYKHARQAFKQGQNPLEDFALTGNEDSPSSITRGLRAGAGRVGFKYGIELEYESHTRSGNHNFGTWLANQGLSNYSTMRPYHSSEDYSKWRWESDASVTGEVISRILKDQRTSWMELNAVVEKMKSELDAYATQRVGAHIHVDVSDMNSQAWYNLGLLISRFEDVLYRIGSNPLRTVIQDATTPLPRLHHRGTRYTSPLARTLNSLLDAHSDNKEGFVRSFKERGSGIANTRSVSGDRGHIEFRFWDGSIDMSIIELQVKVTAAIMRSVLDDSLAERLLPLESSPLGTHREARREITRNEEGRTRVRTNLTGEQWAQDTLRFRQFADIIFTSDKDKRQLTTLFAMTSW